MVVTENGIGGYHDNVDANTYFKGARVYISACFTSMCRGTKLFICCLLVLQHY